MGMVCRWYGGSTWNFKKNVRKQKHSGQKPKGYSFQNFKGVSAMVIYKTLLLLWQFRLCAFDS